MSVRTPCFSALRSAVASFDSAVRLLEMNVEEVGWQTELHDLLVTAWREASDAMLAISQEEPR